jgi:excisionase family DNA binding protein
MSKQIEPKIAPSGLMTVRSAAIYLGVSEDSLRWRIRNKQIPFMKWGGSVRFRQSDLDKWIESKIVAC